MKKKLFTILTLTGLFMFPLFVVAQYDFNDVANKPVLGWGEPGKWDDGHVWNPSVIKDGDTLKMWYTGGDKIVWEEPFTQIGYAWSLDGVEWTRHPKPVLTAREEYRTFGCAVIKDDTTYKMWYGEATLGSYDLPWRIAYATSEDGINWNKESSYGLKIEIGEWDDYGIVPQTVIKTGESYRMYYWACRTGFPYDEAVPQTGMATSENGIHWGKYNDPSTTDPPYEKSDPVFKLETDDTRAFDPMVVKLGDGYHMFYAGAGEGHWIGYAKSSNGINWTRHPDPVLTDPTWGNTLYGGAVLAFDNYFHVWFAPFHSVSGRESAAPQIGYAKCANPLGVYQSEDIAGLKIYPNPFRGTAVIKYELTQPEAVTITIYNQLGELVNQMDKKQANGKQQIVWDAEGLPPGIYFAILKSSTSKKTIKLIKLN